MAKPIIIQGGMGVAVSGWRLAQAVAQTGQLGVVSASLLPVVQARLLQQGDPDGHLRRAFTRFPDQAMAHRVLAEYFVPGGLPSGRPFKLTPLPALNSAPALIELTVLANFAEVFLAREGHDGPIGINLLEKIQLATLPSLFGAMLGGVDYVLMGAGIPRSIPGVLDRLAAGEIAELKIEVEGAAPEDNHVVTLDPRRLFPANLPRLTRPKFLAIVSSSTLAATLARKSNGQVDGFVVEGTVAGGHNAPPRGPMQLTPTGEPIYGARDLPDLSKIRELGLPFWLAGSYARPEKLAEALAHGATGVQLGTAFAFCEESGILPDLKRRFRELIKSGTTLVHTDPLASPTGFPFKVAQLAGTLSDAATYAARQRICDLGYLRQLFKRPDGSVGYRCAGEPEADYLRKGGALAATVGRKCLCNGLAATVGLGQARADGRVELPLITAGDDLSQLARFFRSDGETYRAADVIAALLSQFRSQPA